MIESVLYLLDLFRLILKSVLVISVFPEIHLFHVCYLFLLAIKH